MKLNLEDQEGSSLLIQEMERKKGNAWAVSLTCTRWEVRRMSLITTACSRKVQIRILSWLIDTSRTTAMSQAFKSTKVCSSQIIMFLSVNIDERLPTGAI